MNSGKWLDNLVNKAQCCTQNRTEPTSCWFSILEMLSSFIPGCFPVKYLLYSYFTATGHHKNFVQESWEVKNGLMFKRTV